MSGLGECRDKWRPNAFYLFKKKKKRVENTGTVSSLRLGKDRDTTEPCSSFGGKE